MLNLSVLVLNQNYEPLNICNVKRAVVLLLRGKAEALENGRGEIHSPTMALSIPSVIRLVYFIRRPLVQRKMTRREIFLRDNYRCQYCGKETRNLTLDHVIPRYRGGIHEWTNVVSACIPCNRKKAGRTPREAGMTLKRTPLRPIFTPYHIVYPFLAKHSEWHKFVPDGKWG